jgi:hypothetical protein
VVFNVSFSIGLAVSLESIDPMGDDANLASNRNDALADWKSFCICATWPGITIDRMFSGDPSLFRPMLAEGVLTTAARFSSDVSSFKSCGLLETEGVWWRIFEKNSDDRLRGGSNGAVSRS